jgi:hypothetical protein
MQRLNAIDAITPAFTRTHEILFQPFRVGRSWKLAAAQYFGQIGAFFAPMPLMLLLIPTSDLDLGVARPFLAVLFTVMTLLFFGLFYLGLRLQFVNFEMVVTRSTFIGPMWRRYGARVWPVIGFKVLMGTVISIAMAPFLWKSVAALIQLSMHLPQFTPGQSPDPAIFQSTFGPIMSLEGVVMAAFLLIKLFSSAFEDFVLPFYILEDISLTAAIGRGFAVFMADPLHCILYLILKPILFIVGFIIQYVSMLVLMIPIVIVVVIVAIVGVAISAALGGSSGPGHLLALAAGVVLYIAFLAAALWYQFGTLGYITMLLEAYGVYFLGGRYPLLGNMLEPGPGAPFTPPPVFPSDEERRDNDGGPPMPMDPAVA